MQTQWLCNAERSEDDLDSPKDLSTERVHTTGKPVKYWKVL